MGGVLIMSGVLLVASLLVLADAIYQLVRAPSKDDLRRDYYHRWP